MQTYLLISLVACLLLAVGCNSTQNYGGAESSDHTGHLRHVVMFQFKDTATPQQIKSVEDHFARLPDSIPEIIDYEWGTNNSPEGLNDGLTHCFLVTFKDDAGRATYLPHPAHKAFVEELKPILEKAVVIDYVAK